MHHKNCRNPVAAIRRGCLFAGVALALAGCATRTAATASGVNDPFEPANRAVFWVNDVGDRYILRPVASGYERGLPPQLRKGVRNIFSNDAYRRAVFAKLVEDGRLDASVLSEAGADGDPLAFLVSEGGAASITDAAYRYGRHEEGADVILFGTGNRAHVKANVESILRPPLPAPVIERLHRTCGHLSGVGLDLPGPVKA